MASPSYRITDVDRVRRDLERAERSRARLVKVGTVVGVIAGIVLVASLAFGITRGRASASTGSAAQPVAQILPSSPAPTQPSLDASAAAEASKAPTEVEPALPAEASERKAAQVETNPTPAEPEPDPAPANASAPAPQRFKIGIGAAGYEPSVVSAKSGPPIVLTVAQGEGCAAGFLIPDLGVKADNSSADAKVDLGTVDPGTYRFTCGMGMVEGKLVVR